MLANLGIGLFGGDYNAVFSQIVAEREPLKEQMRKLQAEQPPRKAEIERVSAELAKSLDRFAPIRDWTTVHVLLGVTTGLVVLLVNSLSITYFVGTSRWCREVVETYGFSSDYLVRSDAIKHSALPFSVVGMLLVIALAGLGAASYRGASILSTAENYVLPHLIAAWFTLAVLAWSYYVQAEQISANTALIEEITAEVRRVRKERGLDADEEEEDGAGEGADQVAKEVG